MCWCVCVCVEGTHFKGANLTRSPRFSHLPTLQERRAAYGDKMGACQTLLFDLLSHARHAGHVRTADDQRLLSARVFDEVRGKPKPHRSICQLADRREKLNGFTTSHLCIRLLCTTTRNKTSASTPNAIGRSDCSTRCRCYEVDTPLPCSASCLFLAYPTP